MLICRSIYCIHNQKRTCTLENIRLNLAGMCEQCAFESDFEAVELTRAVGHALIEHKKKSARRGGSFPAPHTD